MARFIWYGSKSDCLDGLITQQQFYLLTKKIENKDKPAANKPYDPDLEKKLESIAGLYERKLI